LIDITIDISPELLVIDAAHALKSSQHLLCGHEPPAMYGSQFAHGVAVARHYKRFAPIELAHYLTALVAQLPLGDLPCHSCIVAPVLQSEATVEPTVEPARAAIHLRPTAELAERVLLPGDPGRALALAQVLIAEPKMFNHHRGLWGYTGPANADGQPLTIQATGMGGPSAAIVLSELIALGVRRAIRVGTCGALDPTLELGELVIARESICRDGCSRALADTARVSADRDLCDALIAAAPTAHVGTAVSVDLFYDPEPDRGPHRLGGEEGGNDGEGPAIAIEMESATLFALGARAGVPVACVLAVTDVFDAAGARTRIEDHALLDAAERMGAAAVAALGG